MTKSGIIALLFVALAVFVSAASAGFEGGHTSHNGNSATVIAQSSNAITVNSPTMVTADDSGASASVDVSMTGQSHSTTTATSDGATATATASVDEGTLDTSQCAEAGTVAGSITILGVPVDGTATGAVASQETSAIGEGINIETEANYAAEPLSGDVEANAEAEVNVDEGTVETGQIAAAGTATGTIGDVTDSSATGTIAGATAGQLTSAEGHGIEVETTADVEAELVDQLFLRGPGGSGPEASADASAEAEVDDGVVRTGQVAAAVAAEGTVTLSEPVDIQVDNGKAIGAAAGQVTFAAGRDVEVETEASVSTPGERRHSQNEANAETSAEVDRGVVIGGQFAAAGAASGDVTLDGDPTVSAIGAAAGQRTFAAGHDVELETETSVELAGRHAPESSAETEIEVGRGMTRAEQFAASGAYSVSEGSTVIDSGIGSTVEQEVYAKGRHIEAETSTETKVQGELYKAEAEAGVRHGELENSFTQQASSYDSGASVSQKGTVEGRDGYSEVSVQDGFGRHSMEAETGAFYSGRGTLEITHQSAVAGENSHGGWTFPDTPSTYVAVDDGVDAEQDVKITGAHFAMAYSNARSGRGVEAETEAMLIGHGRTSLEANQNVAVNQDGALAAQDTTMSARWGFGYTETFANVHHNGGGIAISGDGHHVGFTTIEAAASSNGVGYATQDTDAPWQFATAWN